MILPDNFILKMKEILSEEFEDYLKSFEESSYCGLRINTLKISVEDFKSKNLFKLDPVPWCDRGFYYDENIRPAKHPYYHAGLYYLQEPSAMSPGALLPINKNDKVLDICAAPGGKSTHIASRLGDEGFLLANDISATRARGLLKNIELFGIKNVMVTAEEPKKLASKFNQFFDKIVIDAPCSGEGMFRKEPSIIKSWGDEMYDFCCTQQADVLENAVKMLKKGGYILFSTCTFAPEENERTIHNFLNSHQEFELIDLPKNFGFADGIVDVRTDFNEELKKCARLWPHKLKGEGHFIALLHNTQSCDTIDKSIKKDNNDKRLQSFFDFCNEYLDIELNGNIQIINDNIYVIPDFLPDMKGIRILRSGWHMGEIKKNRFEPSQALAMGLKVHQIKNKVEFACNDIEVIKYLKGETIECSSVDDGWCIVTVDGFPLGWGKAQKGRIKNKYPVSWKWE